MQLIQTKTLIENSAEVLRPKISAYKITPLEIIPTAKVNIDKRKLQPYEVLDTKVIGPDFKKRHIPNEADTTLRRYVEKKK